MMKARRSDNPQDFVLLDEVVPMTEKDYRPHQRNVKKKVRVLRDEENVFQIQFQHASLMKASRIILMERNKALPLMVRVKDCQTITHHSVNA